MGHFPSTVFMKHFCRACVFSLLLPVWASAEITVLREYLMGDADPAMVADAVVVTSKDSAGGADLVATGAPLYYRSIERPRFGQHGQPQTGVGVEFDGVSSLTATGMPELVDNFGVEAWFLSNGGALIIKNGTSVGGWSPLAQGWSLECADGVIGDLDGRSDGDGYPISLRSDSMTLGQWHHIAMVRDQGLARLYVDGVYVSPVAKSAAPLPTSDPFIIQGGNGLIDEIRIFSFLPGQFRQEDLSYPMPSASPLEIANSGSEGLDLRWPGTRFKRILETTTDLQAGEWTTLADQTTPMANAFYQVSAPVSGARRFFRLNGLPPSSEWKGRIKYSNYGFALIREGELFAEVDASSILGRSARIGNGFAAARDLGFDASPCVDPATGDSSALHYEWDIFAPSAYAAQLGTESLTRLSGIAGEKTSALHLKPHSLPQLATVAGDPEATWWRVKLTLRHEPFDPNSLFPQEKTYWFRIRYTASALKVEQAYAQLYPAEGL